MAKRVTLSPERERQLVELVQHGDRGALGELLTAYHKRVYHVCLRMVSNADDAAELTQDTLMRACKHVDGFRRGSRFSTWLLRIAMNVSISHLRKAKHRKALSLEQEVAGANGDQATPLKNLIEENREHSPYQSVELGEQVNELSRAVDSLDAALRSVIILRDLQGMEYQQMAEVLAVPVGTVKSRLFRARLALRQALEPKKGEKRQSTMVKSSEVTDV